MIVKFKEHMVIFMDWTDRNSAYVLIFMATFVLLFLKDIS